MQFCLHLLVSLLYGRATLFKFYNNYSIVPGVQILTSFTVDFFPSFLKNLILHVPFHLSEHLIPDYTCNYVAEQSTTYGGENYFSWHTVFSLEQCQSLCSRTRQCDRLTYSEFQLENKCLMYREKDFEEATEVYSTSWSKECPGGKNIRIFNGPEVLIENSVMTVTVRHHKACQVMPNSCPK